MSVESRAATYRALIAHQPASRVEDLAGVTGQGRAQTQQDLLALASDGLITRRQAGWVATATQYRGSRPTPLTYDELADPESSALRAKPGQFRIRMLRTEAGLIARRPDGSPAGWRATCADHPSWSGVAATRAGAYRTTTLHWNATHLHNQDD